MDSDELMDKLVKLIPGGIEFIQENTDNAETLEKAIAQFLEASGEDGEFYQEVKELATPYLGGVLWKMGLAISPDTLSIQRVVVAVLAAKRLRDAEMAVRKAIA